MKTMTCRQFGGPCDMPIQGNTPDEIMNNAKQHMHAIIDNGHEETIERIRETLKNPEKAKQWRKKVVTDFAAASEV